MSFITSTPTEEIPVRRIITAILAAVMLSVLAAPALANPGQPSDGPALFADGEQFRTKDATDLPAPTGGNAHSFDDLYGFDGVTADGQLPVAEAAPGGTGFNGGRWALKVVRWAAGSTPTLVTSSAQVHDLLASGDLEWVHADAIRYFECPLIPYRG
jgi:hypothetical protein